MYGKHPYFLTAREVQAEAFREECAAIIAAETQRITGRTLRDVRQVEAR